MHLSDEQRIVLRDGSKAVALDGNAAHHSTLLAWVAFNSRATQCYDVLYGDLLAVAAHDESAACWGVRRASQRVHWRDSWRLGRLLAAAPAEGERFSLHILPLGVTGAGSFRVLRTYAGETHVLARMRDGDA